MANSDRPRTPVERALDAFALGVGSPADMATLARSGSAPLVRIEIRLRQPPLHGERVRLPFSGRGRNGPLSAEGFAVQQLGRRRYNGQWGAVWRREDLINACPSEDAKP